MAKILIVEDEKPINQLMKQNLVLQGHQVVQAFDGEEALEKLDERADYDLVILDIQLPKMSGFEILDKLKEEKKEIPNIILVSAFAMDADKLKAKEYGIEKYITKPIDINNFLKNVKESLN